VYEIPVHVIKYKELQIYFATLMLETGTF